MLHYILTIVETSKVREQREAREMAQFAAAEKKRRRSEITRTLDEEIEDMASTPTSEFDLPITTHHCFLRRSGILIRNVWTGIDFRGEIDTYVTFLRDCREAHYNAGMHDFYSACRIAAGHAEQAQAFIVYLKRVEHGPDAESTSEESQWASTGRKLDRIVKLLVAEQNMVLRSIRRDMANLFV